jgi:hypothetical protein
MTSHTYGGQGKEGIFFFKTVPRGAVLNEKEKRRNAHLSKIEVTRSEATRTRLLPAKRPDSPSIAAV